MSQECICQKRSQLVHRFDRLFIFGMYIDVVPRSNIGILLYHFFIIKDHLWRKYLLCDIPLHFQLMEVLAVRARRRRRTVIPFSSRPVIYPRMQQFLLILTLIISSHEILYLQVILMIRTT